MNPVYLRRTAAAFLLIGVLANLVYAVTVPLGGSVEEIRAGAAERPAAATIAAVLDTVFRIGVSIGALGLAQLARRRPSMATGGAWLVVVGAICLTVLTAVTLSLAESGVADPDQVVTLITSVQGNLGFGALLAAGFAALTVGLTLLLVALSADGRHLRWVIALFILGSVLSVGFADVRLAQVAAAFLTGAALVRLAILPVRPTESIDDGSSTGTDLHPGGPASHPAV